VGTPIRTPVVPQRISPIANEGGTSQRIWFRGTEDAPGDGPAGWKLRDAEKDGTNLPRRGSALKRRAYAIRASRVNPAGRSRISPDGSRRMEREKGARRNENRRCRLAAGHRNRRRNWGQMNLTIRWAGYGLSRIELMLHRDQDLRRGRRATLCLSPAKEHSNRPQAHLAHTGFRLATSAARVAPD